MSQIVQLVNYNIKSHRILLVEDQNTSLITTKCKNYLSNIIQQPQKNIFCFQLLIHLFLTFNYLKQCCYIFFLPIFNFQVKKIRLVINISILQNLQSIENIQLQEQLFDQNIFQSIMKKKTYSSSDHKPLCLNHSSESPLDVNQSIQQTISRVLETLDAPAAIDYLNSLQPNNHMTQCYKAQTYFKLDQINEAKKACEKAFDLESSCTKCIYLYLEIGQNTADNQNFISFLSKKFETNKFVDSFLSTKISKAKTQSFIQDHFRQFFDDLKFGGAQFSKIKLIQNQEDNRSVVANCDMKKEETIVFIPKKKLILLQTAKSSEIVKKIHQEKIYLRSPKHCQLSIFLLQQQQLGEKSQFFHYINHFPKAFSTFPVNFTEQELNLLKGSPFLEQVEQKIIDMRKDYEALCSISQKFQSFSFQNFKRYRLIVSSRIFGITIGKNRTDALVPLADMLNHHLPKQTSWYYSDLHQGFLIKSLKSIPKGQQIYDSYGQKCNSRFLLNYGFTLQNNQANQVAIRISIQFQDKDKDEIFKQIILKISKNVQSKQFQEMISVLRYSVNEELSNGADEITLQSIKKTPFQDMDIQLKIWQKLQKIIQGQISAYPTTLRDDKKLLTEKDLPRNVYNCIMLRKGQKQILLFYANMCKKLIKFFKRGCAVKGNELKSYENYLIKINFS